MKYDIYYVSEKGILGYDGQTDITDESTIYQGDHKPVPIFDAKPEDISEFRGVFFLVRLPE
jgi:hypothetical protein